MENSFKGKGIVSNGVLNLSANEAYELLSEGAVLIDIREEFLTEMKILKAEKYILCPNKLLAENIKSFSKINIYIVVDSTGLHSKNATEILMKEGFIAANLAGGVMDWERDGLPVIKDPASQLSGQCPCMLKPMNKIRKN